MKYCDQCHSTFPTDFTLCPRDQSTLRMITDLATGMVIRGKYEILEKIGAGGMASVYRARHLAFHEERAIKIVSSRLLDDESFIKRFRNEAVVTRRLKHPNAVSIEDLDSMDDGRPFMVLEFVKGRDLRAAIRQSGAMQPARAISIARQVCAALGAAHALGITHRDIKPDNILLTEQSGTEVVKVLDFGIAKVREAGPNYTSAYTATQTGMVVGTPQYISPEQAMGKQGDAIDGRADIYSLGVVLYEMLTGQLPFDSDTPVGLLLHHIQTSPTPPHQLRPDLNIPEPLSLLLMKALEKDRERRFQSAEEFERALSQVSTMTPTEAHTAFFGSDMTGIAPTPLPHPVHDAPTVRGSAAAATLASAPQTRSVPPGTAVSAPEQNTQPAPWSFRKKMATVAAVLAVLALLRGGLNRGSDDEEPEAKQPVVAAEQQPESKSEPETKSEEPQPEQKGSEPGQDEAAQAVERAEKIVAAQKIPSAEEIEAQIQKGMEQIAKSNKAGLAPGSSPTTPEVPKPPTPGESVGPGTQTNAPSPEGYVRPQLTPEQHQQIRRLLLLGKQQADAGRLAAAAQSFGEVLAIDPHNPLALEGMRRLGEAAKQRKQAGPRRR